MYDDKDMTSLVYILKSEESEWVLWLTVEL